MAEKKEYRNAIRSRMLIRKAYLELLYEKPYEKVTATDIIKRADINRSTFYAHYPDAKGIMDEIVDEVVDKFRKTLAAIDFSVFFDDPMPILREMVSFLRENQELYRHLASSQMILIQLEKLKEVLIQQVLETPNLPVKDPHSISTVIRVRLILSGAIDTYRQWLAGEFACTLDEATEEVAQIIRLWASEALLNE